MALPLSLHQDEDRSVLLLSDSEDDDDGLMPLSRQTSGVVETEVARQKAKETASSSNVPVHPITAMQPAFAESLAEATKGGSETKPKLRFGDAKQRRARLLEGSKGSGLHADRWRYRPGQKHHELWKLLAQVSFGVYLLLNGIANSNEQVVDILQQHIDEVDEFLETTLEDVNLAVEEIDERIEFLKLPMENAETFDEMLEDRDFRLQIVTGNEQIEHIIDRTTLALNATFQDVEEGLEGVREFAVYLGDQKDKPWRQQRPEFEDIYDAMKGNAQGWYQALNDIQDSAAALENTIETLGDIVTSIYQKVGEVSRRTRFSVAPFSGPAEKPPLSPPKRHPGRTMPPVAENERPSPARSPLPTPLQTVSRSPHDPQSPQSSRSSQSSQSTQSPQSQSHHQSPQPQSQSQHRFPQPLSPAEKEVVFFEEKEVALVQPVNSIINHSNSTPELQVPDAHADADLGVYLLQPRTYTPQPPEPLPSPMVKNPPPRPPPPVSLSPATYSPPTSTSPVSVSQNGNGSRNGTPQLQSQQQPQQQPQQGARLSKRTSLRQRVSQQGGIVPNVIHVPPRNRSEAAASAASASSSASPPQTNSNTHSYNSHLSHHSPQYQLSPHTYKERKSEYVSGLEVQVPVRPSVRQVSHHSHPSPIDMLGGVSGGGIGGMAAVPRLTNAIPSPQSDHQQYFYPVRASPHSPLQQRPHTSATNVRPHTSHSGVGIGSGGVRDQRSAMGMSMLSNVTNANNGGVGVGGIGQRGMESERERKLKKKKSAFGWLKKAFTLDEEEREQFRARQQTMAPNPYYETRSAKFLDGKRLPADPNSRRGTMATMGSGGAASNRATPTPSSRSHYSGHSRV